MARGQFGRRKRGNATNLTALIASLLREQRQAEDRAIFDAYQNGGKFQGKLVDDARILAYMKGRRDGFSTDDPLYDEWNNRLIQTRFSIGEQKIGLAFKQGRASAGAVAAFYRGQLKSIPRNSAFYREVAGRAADWAKSAAGAARGRARGRASAGTRAKLNAQLEKQQSYLALERALTAYARRAGVISGSQTLADADATALQDMFDQGIYSGKDRITLNDFRSAAKDHYVALGGEISTRLSLGQQAVEARNKRSRFLDETLVRLNAIDDRGKYEMAREVLSDKVKAAGGDPYAVRAAYDEYAKSLRGIHEVAIKAGDSNVNDPEFIGGLVNEVNAVEGGKNTGATVADVYDMTDEVGSGQDLADDVAVLNDDLKRLEKKTAYYGQTEPGGQMGVVDWPPGAQGALGLDDSLQPSITRVNGQRRVVYLKGESVSASAIIDVNTGSAIDPKAMTAEALRAAIASGALEIKEGGNVGYIFTNSQNGTVKYGVRDSVSGQMLFTDENPWTSGAINAGDGLTVFGALKPGGKDGEEMVVDPNSVLAKPLDINTGDPLMSDSTVAPSDLLALVEDGTLGATFTEDQAELYRQRLLREQQEQDRARMYDDAGGLAKAGIIPTERVTGGGGDLRSDVLNAIAGITSITPTVQTLFGGLRPPDSRETTFVPPPPPKPPEPTLKPPEDEQDAAVLLPDQWDDNTDARDDDTYYPNPPPEEEPELEGGDTVFRDGKKYIV